MSEIKTFDGFTVDTNSFPDMPLLHVRMCSYSIHDTDELRYKDIVLNRDDAKQLARELGIFLHNTKGEKSAPAKKKKWVFNAHDLAIKLIKENDKPFKLTRDYVRAEQRYYSHAAEMADCNPSLVDKYLNTGKALAPHLCRLCAMFYEKGQSREIADYIDGHIVEMSEAFLLLINDGEADDD